MADYLNPEDIAAQSGIARQQKLAEMLFAQGAQQPQGQMISGQYVKSSPLQFMANLANQYAGMKTGEAAEKAQLDLAQKIRAGKATKEAEITDYITGTPEKTTELAGPYAGNVPMPTAVLPATSPNLISALKAINTNNPYGAGSEYKAALVGNMIPKTPEDVARYKYAQSPEGGGFRGTYTQWVDFENSSKRPITNNIVNTGQRGFENTLKLGENWKNEPIYKAHQEVSQAFKQVNNALDRNDAAGDLTAAIKINKMFDPTGVVRETEAARIAASRGTLDTMLQLTAKITKGESLTPTQRKQYKSLVKDFYDISGEQYNETRAKYAEIGKVNELSGTDTILGAPWKPSVTNVAPITKNMQDANKILGIPPMGKVQ
jgi:hypothetical protein